MAATERVNHLAAFGAISAAVIAGVLLGLGGPDLRTIHIGFTVVLAVAAFGFDGSAREIPRVLRPGPVLYGALLLGAWGTLYLSPDDHAQFFGLWVCQVVGFTIGWAFVPRLGEIGASTDISPTRMLTLTRALWVLAALSTLAFFALQGIPLLQPDAEQARVDASASGTGYLRLVASLIGPASLMMFAARGRASWPYVVIAALLLMGSGNRVPLVYLALPLLAMLAVTGRRVGSVRMVAAGLVVLAVVGGLGTYRIMNTPEFARYDEYRVAIAERDLLGVGVAAVSHYAKVVPANAVLTKDLVDSGRISWQWGRTYGTLFLSALPGRQLSPDLLIKEASGAEFLGGGTPPTLAGEGYMNLGYLGAILGAAAMATLLRFWASASVRSQRVGQSIFASRMTAIVYGYVATWAVVSQVAGIAGASTATLAGFLAFIALRRASAR